MGRSSPARRTAPGIRLAALLLFGDRRLVLRDFVIALNLSDFLLNGGYLGAVVQQGVG